MEKELEADTNNKNIPPRYIEKYATILMKSGKRETEEEMQLPNHENIRTLGEEENTIP